MNYPRLNKPPIVQREMVQSREKLCCLLCTRGSRGVTNFRKKMKAPHSAQMCAGGRRPPRPPKGWGRRLRNVATPKPLGPKAQTSGGPGGGGAPPPRARWCRMHQVQSRGCRVRPAERECFKRSAALWRLLPFLVLAVACCGEPVLVQCCFGGSSWLQSSSSLLSTMK